MSRTQTLTFDLLSIQQNRQTRKKEKNKRDLDKRSEKKEEEKNIDQPK